MRQFWYWNSLLWWMLGVLFIDFIKLKFTRVEEDLVWLRVHLDYKGMCVQGGKHTFRIVITTLLGFVVLHGLFCSIGYFMYLVVK